MKTLLKNSINELDLKTTSIGLQRLNNKKEQAYHFYWVSSDKKPLIISKKYATPDARNKALKSLEKDQFETKIVEKEKQFYIQLLNEKQQQIASSPSFENETLARKNLLHFGESFTKKSKEKTDKPPTAKDLIMLDGDAPVRQSFSLVFYKRTNTPGDWHGIISHPRSKKQSKISAVNDPEINKFINEHLHQSFYEQKAETKPKSDEHSIEWGALGKTYQLGSPLQLRYLSKKNTSAAIYEAKLEAKSMVDQKSALIGRVQANFQQEKAMVLEAKTRGMDAGLYRLTATLRARDQEEDNHPLVEESRLVLFT